MKDIHMTPVEEVNSDKTEMALQSALPALVLETFSKDAPCLEDEAENFRLHLSEDDDDGSKSTEELLKDPIAPEIPAELEDDILNKFDQPEAEPPEDKSAEEQPLDEQIAEKCDEAVSQEAPKTTEEGNLETETQVPEEPDAECVVGEVDPIPSRSSEAEITPPEDLNSSFLSGGLDTEDLLKVTTVKEVQDDDNMEEKDDASNSCDSSEKDEADEMSEEVVEKEAVEDVEMEEPLEEPMECASADELKETDLVEIEESPALVADIATEVDKEYRDMTIAEEETDEKVDESATTGAVQTKDESDVVSEHEHQQVEAVDGPVCDISVSTETVSVVSAIDEKETKAEAEEQETLNGDEEPVKSAKRSLSETDTQDVDTKKMKLSEPECVPEKITILNAFADFMMSKNLEKLSRTCLEEFCLQKMVEAIISKSELGELRHQLQQQEEMVEVWRKEVVTQAKQVKDLEIVNKKLMTELKMRADKDKPIVPVKITRSVGLQVKLVEVVSGSPMKRRVSKGADGSPAQPPVTPVKNGMIKTNSPIPNKQQTKAAPKIASTPLLSQALQKEPLKPATDAKEGVIDLTDEDDKKSSPVGSTTPNKFRTGQKAGAPKTPARTATAPIPQGVQFVTNQVKTTLPGVVNNGQKLIYVVHSAGQTVNQNVLTNASDLTKPGAPKALMFKFPNGILGNSNQIVLKTGFKPAASGQPNGLISTIPNGTSTVSVVPQQPRPSNQPVRLQPPARSQNNSKQPKTHPAPLPQPPANAVPAGGRKPVPPEPHLSIRKSGQGIVLSWKMPYNLEQYEVIASYQLYAYQETSSPPSSEMWRKVGDVKALALPMACTLTQFADGNKYYFAVRAVDVHKRIGAFSEPEPIML